MTEDKKRETATADPRALITMIDYMLPEVNQLSPIAALHLCQANAMLQQQVIEVRKKKKSRK